MKDKLREMVRPMLHETTINQVVNNYDCLIIDVDGTLYKQSFVRISILIQLILCLLRNPEKIRYAVALQKFRSLRETYAGSKMSFDEQVTRIAKENFIQRKVFESFVLYWMFEKPLKYISKHRNKRALHLIEAMMSMGKTVLAYSDYPCENKLSVLGVNISSCYYPGIKGLMELKPSKASIDKVLKGCNVGRNRVLYVGDRDDKDGQSAKVAKIDFLNIRNLRG